ncbi:MAG: hypothetical protein A3B30_01740 [Candidatus Komeilibacteria bacterium RIFCSPLOWO2_01_FULL_52_15]|uniref:Hydrogenase assembly protein HypC n=2 Tax=Candidatus Komeiliibacteriota TaxID=1817908 RepID=A0A1G2BRY4_9BACT|nr:MAG: hypothetical protein A2677_03230 [Candidatus Komeilibacteria bacterium RIFCSPHIGHO2_01_FULL_52_14]OGY91945.1 MAG: hypothetical protein A3B30_01740 [Candidatus Komeilibacteria bacterium RIFCSPLOWO2_01_FULL_52_15]
MCFTIPRKIVSVHGTVAVLEDGTEADIEGIPGCRPDDYLFVTSGIAIERIDKDDGDASRRLIKKTYVEISNRN